MNERKKKVLQVAQKLFIEKGFQNTSIQDILEEAKISKGTFYNYFSSKNECLVAIIEIGREEVERRRRQFLLNIDVLDLNDREILIEQMAILWQVNKDENLVPIFEAVFQSGDPDLKKIVTKNYFKEMRWLASRIIDIYGIEAKPYSYDATILLNGMLRQMVTTWGFTRKDPYDVNVILRFVLKRMDVIIPQLISEGEILLGDNLKECSENKADSKTVSEKQIISSLKTFLEEIEDEDWQAGMEYIDMFIGEIQSKKPRYFVIESILLPFIKIFENSLYKKRAHEIARLIWNFIEEKRK